MRKRTASGKSTSCWRLSFWRFSIGFRIITALFHMSNVHNDNEHSVNRSNRKIAPVFVYPALRVMYSTATPCRVSIVTLDGKEATSGISSTPIKL